LLTFNIASPTLANYVAEISSTQVVCIAQTALSLGSTLLLTLKEALMKSRPFPEIPCLICSKPVDLSADLSADENGKAVHTECYVKRIITPQASSSIAVMAD
jgi:hypothetical protein